MMVIPAVFFIICISLQSVSVYGQEQLYEATYVGKLPTPRFGSVAAYDGNDIIYVMGGYYENATVTDVLTYSISSNTLQVVGHFDLPFSYASAAIDRNGNIFHFGGRCGNPPEYQNTIFRLTADEPQPVAIGVLPGKIGHQSAVVGGDEDADAVYLIGGTDGVSATANIVRYNTTTNTAFVVAKLPVPRSGTAAARNGESIYIFGGYDTPTSNSNHILRYTPSNGSMQVLPQELHTGTLNAEAFFSDGQAFVIGGLTFEDPHSLTVFDMDMGTLNHFFINSFPEAMQLFSAVFVESLRRIYTFGGRDSNWATRDDIFYIQL